MAMHINNEGISNMSNNHNVNHPPHYNQGVIECIDAIRAATTGLDPYEAFLAASAIKYIWRYNLKSNPVEDIEKAIWYLNKIIEKRGESANAEN